MPALALQGTPVWATGGGGSSQPVYPTGYTATAGDLAFLYTGVAEGNATLAAPSGWLDVPGQPANCQRIFWRKLIGGDVLPPMTWVGAFNTASTCLVLRGPFDVNALFDAQVLRQASSTNSVVYSGLAISGDNEFIFEFGFRTKTSLGDGETLGAQQPANTPDFASALAPYVGAGTSILLCVNYVQQTTKSNIVSGGQITSKTDAANATVRGFSIAIKTQAAASAGFTAGPNVNAVTAIPTATATIGFTPNAAGNFFAVALAPGTAAPTAVQIQGGLDGTGAPALAAVSKAVTAADTAVLGGALSIPKVDIYCCLHTTVDSPVAALLGQFLKPTTGRQFVAVSGPPDPTQDSILAGAVPAAVAGDIIECDSLTSPSSFPLFMTSTGVASYTGTGSLQSFRARVYQLSSNTWSALVTDYVNDAPPVYVGGVGPLALPLSAAITPIDLTPAFTDADGDPLVITALNGLPAGMSVTGNKLAGAGTVQGIYTVNIQAQDPAGATAQGPVAVIIGNVQVPQPLVGQTAAAAGAALDAALFVAKSVLVPSALTAGTVIAAAPAEGSYAPPFSTVVLSIAAPLPVIVPPSGPPSPTPTPPPIQQPGAIVAHGSVTLTLSDLFQNWGNDLSLSNTQDLLLVSDTLLGQQRVLRRLLTNPGDYLFQPDYGAGLPKYIGQTVDIAKITALIRSQILLEAVVAKDPAPQITVTTAANSTDASAIAVTIAYTDAPTGVKQTLSFSLSKTLH